MYLKDRGQRQSECLEMQWSVVKVIDHKDTEMPIDCVGDFQHPHQNRRSTVTMAVKGAIS